MHVFLADWFDAAGFIVIIFCRPEVVIGIGFKAVGSGPDPSLSWCNHSVRPSLA